MTIHVPHPPATRPASTYPFWLCWATASVVGAAPGLILACVYAVIDVDALLAVYALPPALMTSVVVVMILAPGILVGLGVGKGQARATAGKLKREWLWANTIGFGLTWCFAWSLVSGKLEGFNREPNVVATGVFILFAYTIYLLLPQLVILGVIDLDWLDWAMSEGTLAVPISLFWGLVMGIPIIAVISLSRGEWQADVSFAAVATLAAIVAAQAIVSGQAVDVMLNAENTSDSAGDT